MSANDRLALFPSRANLVQMKQRIVAASRGLNLLKRKRDALELKLREMRAELEKYSAKLTAAMQEAFFSISRANYMGTDFKPASVMLPDRADAFLRLKNDKVVGLLLPKYELLMHPPTCFPLTGLSRGGHEVEIIRQKFQDALRILIALASLEYAVQVLEESVHQNNMRVNGLEYVVIPRFINTVNYIRDELDEFEREDFYRLKRSQAKQRKNRTKFAMMLKVKSLSPEELAMLEESGVVVPNPLAIDENFRMNEFDEKVRRSTALFKRQQAEPKLELELGLQLESTSIPDSKPIKMDMITQTSEPLAQISLFDFNADNFDPSADNDNNANEFSIQTQTSGSFDSQSSSD